MNSHVSDQVLEDIRKCYLRGHFKLTSGGVDTNYVDLWLAMLRKGSLQELAKAILVKTELEDLRYNVVAGLELAALPLAVACMLHNPLVERVALVRKERRTHGTENLIEGFLDITDSVLIVEDVASTGNSMAKAIRAVEDHRPPEWPEGMCCTSNVVGAVAIVDRLEGATQLLHEECEIHLQSICVLRNGKLVRE